VRSDLVAYRVQYFNVQRFHLQKRREIHNIAIGLRKRLGNDSLKKLHCCSEQRPLSISPSFHCIQMPFPFQRAQSLSPQKVHLLLVNVVTVSTRRNPVTHASTEILLFSPHSPPNVNKRILACDLFFRR
jgi:hypothetical protein